MPSLFERTLIGFGDGKEDLIVTIPRAWARFHQLKPGDKVEMVTNDEIVIRLKSREAPEEETPEGQP